MAGLGPQLALSSANAGLGRPDFFSGLVSAVQVVGQTVNPRGRGVGALADLVGVALGAVRLGPMDSDGDVRVGAGIEVVPKGHSVLIPGGG